MDRIFSYGVQYCWNNRPTETWFSVQNTYAFTLKTARKKYDYYCNLATSNGVDMYKYRLVAYNLDHNVIKVYDTFNLWGNNE